MNRSTWDDERITEYVIGEMPADEAARLKADIQSDAELARAVEEARNIKNLLVTMFADETPMVLDAARREQILDTPEEKLVTPKSSHEFIGATHASTRRYFAMAATVLLLATTAMVVYRSNRSKNAEVALGVNSAPKIDRPPMSPIPSSTAPASKERWAVEEGAVTADHESMDFKADRADAPGTPAPAAANAMSSEEMPLGAASALYVGENTVVEGPGTDVPPVPGNVPRMMKEAVVESITDLPFSAAATPNDPSEMDKRLFDPAAGQMAASGLAPGGDAVAETEGKAKAASDASPSNSGFDQFSSGAEGLGGMGMGMDTAMGMRGGTSLADQDEAGGSDMPTDVSAQDNFGMGLGRSEDFAEYRHRSIDPAKPSSPESVQGLELAKRDSLHYEGRGAGLGGDRFEPFVENNFKRVVEEPLSTFSIDVDTASYSKVRQFIAQADILPPPGAVRIEELVNYFEYGYEPPAANSEHPFVSRVEVAACPWNEMHRLARIAIKGKVMEKESRPASNLVFLADTSGSMEEPNKLPLVKQGLKKLVSQLGERDRVAIVVYAGSAGLVLDSTPASERSMILRKINQMQSGGSTNGGEGIRLAYRIARDHFIDGGVNRVILCSDGDFNVGVTSNDELVELVEQESKGGIDITVLGFGMGNHNDSMMEQISNRGNGNYAFIDTAAEAERVLVEQASGTLVTIARDVKIQVEFNPMQVGAYRLIGYENRKLAAEDFKDDTKDAGEIGAGHAVTALYELVPADGDMGALAPVVDELRYQKNVTLTEASKSGEWMTVNLRYKQPGSDTSIPISFPASDKKKDFSEATGDFRFAASVAGFGMILRSSEHIGSWTMSDVIKVAEAAKGDDMHGLRTEFVELARKAAAFRGQER